jgi:hypothetical protein
MLHTSEWKALSSRIQGLMQAGELHARFLMINSSDTYGRARRLREHCEGSLKALELYAESHKDRIPAFVVGRIKEFVGNHRTLFSDASGTSDSLDQRVWAALVLLGGLESEISFALSDIQEEIRARSERAFVHLQRSIVADPEVHSKWGKAYANGEVDCEQLGGVHLLAHGIFAFKVGAQGERTDLVYQDIVSDLADKERYADGLVLTEWKKAKTVKEAEKQFVAARKQAANYAVGSLGGTELTEYRYAVVVSDDAVATPQDIREGLVTYRHINVAVNPKSPSKRA